MTTKNCTFDRRTIAHWYASGAGTLSLNPAKDHQGDMAQCLAWRLTSGEVWGSNPGKGENHFFLIKRNYYFKL